MLGVATLTAPNDAAVELSSRKSLALLIYLASQAERRASRERLAALLWEDASSSQARLNLRKALSTLRRDTQLKDRQADLVCAKNDSVWLAPGALITDVEEFEAALASDDTSAAAHSADLYTGDFLVDFSVRGAPAFEAWALVERQRLREFALTALTALMERALDRGLSPEVGLRAAMRVLALDPLQERAHRAMMRLLVRQGRRAAALKHFHALSERLQSELNTLPETATRDLFKEISAARHARRAEAKSEEGAEADQAVSDDHPTREIEATTQSRHESRHRRGLIALAVALGVAATAGGLFLSGEHPFSVGRLLAASTRQEKSIAVLPFANFSTEAETGLFADGLTEELINSLAQHGDLKVAGRTSAFFFKDKNIDLREVGRKLGVAYVVEGSVRREGDRLRVTAQLINVADGFHVWSGAYDRGIEDAFLIQGEVARSVAEELTSRVGREGGRTVKAPDGRAYPLYLVARGHMRSGGKDEIVTARRLFERQLAITPDDPRALAGYAEATIELANRFLLPIDEAKASSEAAIARALRLDPNSAEAYAARSRLSASLARWTNEPRYEELARSAAKRAVELAPRNPDALSLYGRQLLIHRPDEAVAVLRRAIELDPLSRSAQVQLATAYRATGRFEDAVRQYQTAVELFPDYDDAWVSLGRLLFEQGRAVEAERALLSAPSGPKSSNYRAYFYFNLGLPEEAANALDTMRSPPIVGVIGRTLRLHLARDYRGALAFAESEVAKDPDSHMRGIIYLNAAILGDYSKARGELPQLAPELLAETPDVDPSALDVAMIAAHVLNHTGEQAQAHRILMQTLAVTEPGPIGKLPPSAWLARVNAYAELGQTTRAMTELRRALDAGYPERVDFDNFIHLEDWPSMKPLRADPRFRAMIGEIEARNRRMKNALLASRS